MSSSHEQLSSLVQELNNSEIDYRIVGGVARRAYTGEGLGKLKEVDLLIGYEALSVPAQRAKIYGIWSKFNENGLRVDTYPSECIHLDNGVARAKVLGKEFDLPSTLFAPVKKSVDGVEIKTVDPLTLLHLFSGFGAIRKKDWGHMLDLGRCTKRGQLSVFSEKDYQYWHDNLRQIYRENRITLLFLQIKRNLKNLLPESIIKTFRPLTESPMKNFYNLTQKVDKFFDH